MISIKDKTLLITGGTGSFGETILNHFLHTDIGEIRIFSRDEKKQEDLRLKYKNPKLNFIIGDVRDFKSINQALFGVDYLFQAAALKQVHTCEFFPLQAIQTNILGSENVLEAAIQNRVSRTVVLSTDKAVYPINTMGMTKALMEKLAISKSRDLRLKDSCAKIMVTRYGNVMCSRGSVIPLFIEQIKLGREITITQPQMTRFLMSLDESVSLVLNAFERGNSGDIMVQKAPACTVGALAKALLDIFQAKNPIKIIGPRHGEKLFETLCGREEMAKVQDLGHYYKISPDMRDINYTQYSDTHLADDSLVSEYNSSNTTMLSHEEIIATLMQQPYVREHLER
jgi:UDP-N-acetylglucosamine 4,6-dehydratase